MGWSYHENGGKRFPPQGDVGEAYRRQRRRGKLRMRLLNDIDNDLMNIEINAWRRRALNRDAWKKIM